MGSRFIQIDLEFVDSKACGVLAARLACDREQAAGKMLRVWGWAVEQAIKSSENDPIRAGIVAETEAEMLVADAARWTSEPARFVDAMVAAGFAERVKKGVRFRGWEERYGSMLRKQFRDAKKPRGNRSASRAGPERDAGGTAEGFQRADPDRRDQIADPDRRDRSIDQVPEEKAPTREPTKAVAFFDRMQKRRGEVFPNSLPQELHREAGQKRRNEFAVWSQRFNELLEQVGGNEERLWRAYETFLGDEWARSCPDPCPWQGFAKQEVFRRCVRDQGAGAASADGTPGVRVLRVIPYAKGERPA